MKKLLLLLPFVLFSCSMDSNLDGQFTISDISLSFKEYVYGFGEPLFNLLVKTGIFEFLEIDMLAATEGIITISGMFLLIIAITIILGIGQLFFVEIMFEAFKEALKEWQRESQLQKDNHLGIFKKIIRWIKRIVENITGLIWALALMWLYLAISIYVLKP